jgi:hypothetical protein
MDSCLPVLMAGATYTDRLPLLPRGSATVTLDISATSTSAGNQEILWTLMETTPE